MWEETIWIENRSVSVVSRDGASHTTLRGAGDEAVRALGGRLDMQDLTISGDAGGLALSSVQGAGCPLGPGGQRLHRLERRGGVPGGF